MNRRKLALGALMLVGGLSIAAHNLLSFQMDAAGAKGLARALIGHVGTDMGIETAVQDKVSGLAEFGIDQAAPVLSTLYQNMSVLDAGVSEKDAEARFADINKSLTALVDVKDRLVAEAGKTLSPRERATAIVKVGSRWQEHHSPQGVEGAIAGFRAARQDHMKHELKMDDARAKQVFAAMDKYAAQRKAAREERRAAFEALKLAVGGSDAAVVQALTAWDKVTAKTSDLARAQIAEAGKLFTTAEKLAMVKRAKQRVDRAMTVVALIGKFSPIKG